MGLVHIQNRLVPGAQRLQGGQVGAVTIHAEHRFGDHQSGAVGIVGQQLLQMLQIIVAKAQQLGFGQEASRIQAGMNQFVGQHHRLQSVP